MKGWLAYMLCLGLVAWSPWLVEGQDGEAEGRAFLAEYNAAAEGVRSESVNASWLYNTNLTDYNQQRSLEASARRAAFDKEAAVNASRFDWQNFTPLVKREFSKITNIGSAVLPDNKLNQKNQLGANMTRIYSTAQVCIRPGGSPGRCYPLDPDLTEIMATSRDWDDLVWAWQGWRDESGKKMPALFEEFVSLSNEAARTNGYADEGEYWRSGYEMEGFIEECERLWKIIKPLYVELHGYVARKLRERYFNRLFPASGHIPAHLLGNMWAQQWGNIKDIVSPFPNKPTIDVTDEMIRQGYNATSIFLLSEEFFNSLGLIPMPQEFWDHSMITKPEDRPVVCHASAWDFYNRKDFRIKQCTEVTQSWLVTTHHEMGHVEYYLQYKEQPVQFRRGANPGFHEAIGDVMALSVITPEHLQKIGLLPNFIDDEEVDLNFLMGQALNKLAFIPFGYLIDQWRWSVFAGNTTRENYNQKWWELRCKIQGLSPPVPRADDDFDPGAKFHVPNNTPYIRYFVSHIIQFQFHKALCQAANHTGPLHRCDIYQSKDAGKLIGDMMKLGSSTPWPDAMERIAGTRQMDSQPLVEYFQPLLDWLRQENAGKDIGWTDECPIV